MNVFISILEAVGIFIFFIFFIGFMIKGLMDEAEKHTGPIGHEVYGVIMSEEEAQAYAPQDDNK
jgi:hypothetical protein